MPIKSKIVTLISSCKTKQKLHQENSGSSGTFKLHDGHLKSLMKKIGPESNIVKFKVILVFLKTDFRTEVSGTDILGRNTRYF